jgi:hypothetical protein
MSTGAIAMMVIAITLVWGGLIAAIIQLRRHPDRPEEDATPGGPVG